jgi:hypothetical protein
LFDDRRYIRFLFIAVESQKSISIARKKLLIFANGMSSHDLLMEIAVTSNADNPDRCAISNVVSGGPFFLLAKRRQRIGLNLSAWV